MKKGIDISYWQGNVDFSKVKKDGIEFAILRSSYRKTVDNKFHEYVKECKANRIPILGVYHFSYAFNKEAAIEEAKFCISQVRKAGLSKNTIIFFDFEYDTVEKAAKTGVKLTPKDCNEHTVAFCDYVKSQGYKAGVYANIDYYKNWYDKNVLNKYAFWLADYSGDPDFPCLIHQYSSSGKVNGINGKVDMNHYYEKESTDSPKIRSRQAVVDLVKSWDGKKESDGSYKTIIDIYNSYTGEFPRGIKMEYGWAWCASTWSALAIKLGYTDVMPIEISCGELVTRAKEMGCWQENDAYVPKPADAVLYDWDDNGTGDNKGWPDHIGTVIEVHAEDGYMIIEEGNLKDSVTTRRLEIDGRYIRGFITPKYTDDSVSTAAPIKPTKTVKEVAKEVIEGKWGNGDDRKRKLESAGYDYNEVQKAVNKLVEGSNTDPSHATSASNIKRRVKASEPADKFDKSLAGTYKTTADLYLRNDAGKKEDVLALIKRGTPVNCYGYYSIDSATNSKWLYIQYVIDGVEYTGFSHSGFLKR